MKSPTFERAAQSIFDLFDELYRRGAITVGEAQRFNEAYEIIVLHYNSSIALPACPLPWQDEVFAEAWAQWIKYRKEQHYKPYKSIGLKAALDGLYKDANGDVNRAIEILNYSMKNSYQGLFAPKNGSIAGGSKAKHSAENLLNAYQEAAKSLGL